MTDEKKVVKKAPIKKKAVRKVKKKKEGQSNETLPSAEPLGEINFNELKESIKSDLLVSVQPMNLPEVKEFGESEETKKSKRRKKSTFKVFEDKPINNIGKGLSASDISKKRKGKRND